MDEENTVQALKDGDMSAVDLLYNTYAKNALRTAFLITSDHYLAEDVLQETFIQCIKSIKTLKNNAAFKPWFYTVLVRTAYKVIKHKKHFVPAEDIYDKADTAVYDTYPSENPRILDCIKKLKPVLRSTVVLFYYNELTVKEISRIMQCPQGTVKSRLNTARKILKKEFKEDF
ncbi:MAG: RNA polymerase sigma factor [Firmicutes bacterium]|nr:RNA polymerase sigma factor [Bacillota bacterium]